MERPIRNFKCSMCFFSTVLERHLIHHYVRCHRFDPRFYVKCNENGCGATYRKWNSFKMHRQRKHRHIDVALNEYAVPNNDEDIYPGGDDVPNEEGEERPAQLPDRLLQHQSAKFLFHVRDVCRTSHTAMLKVMEGAQDLLNAFISIAIKEIQEAADPENNSINVARVEEVLTETFPVSELFSHVNTKCKYDRFMIDNFGFIMPKEIELGRGLVWRRKPTVDLVEKLFKGYCIPLLDALKRLLSNDEVRFCVDNPRKSGEVMKTVLDGQYYKQHPLFSQNNNNLGIILYYDELEIVNPLGPRTHKLGMFYWTLANIYPEFRSSLHAVNLLAVARYSDIAKYGIDKILDGFVQDICTLQTEGVTVQVGGREQTYKGSLLMVTADTPAAALLGGFKRSVSASKPCRRCMTDQHRWKLYFHENYFTLRSMQTHREHVAAVTEPNIQEQVRSFWQQMYGVNSGTPLLNIPMFDICKCIVQDIMHVLSEGVLEVAVRVFLKFCIEKGLFHINTINERMTHFSYGHLTKDKPCQILPAHLDNGLRQTASQMVCLAHVLPFLISDLLVDDDGAEDSEAHEKLLCHIKLLQIVNICFSFEIKLEDASFLGSLIETYLLLFNDLYPNALVPKFHFLIHVVDQIREFGPLRQQWCMRFEAAHAWYKSLARVVRNFKNIPWTFAYRQEALRCIQLCSIPGTTSSRFLNEGHSVKPGNVKPLLELPGVNSLLPFLPNIDAETCQVMTSPEVKYLGTTYAPGSVVLVECNDEELPVFGKVTEIYVHNEEILLFYSRYTTVAYFQTLNAYQIVNDADALPAAVNIRGLMHPHPLSEFSFQRAKFIVLFNHTRSEFVL